MPLLLVLLATSVHILPAQGTNQGNLSQQIQQLSEAMSRTEAQLQESQHQLDQMHAQLAELRRLMAQSTPDKTHSTPNNVSPSDSSSSAEATTLQTSQAIEDLRERQDIQASQIATHEQSKIESESKYPLKITGQLLFNGFINTSTVDSPSTPTITLSGPGSTGAALRQTVLGFDASGPHLFGAQSYADLHIDFAGSPQSGSTGTNYTGYYSSNATLLRLRTAHAGLRWMHTETYFSLDRPIFSPDTPTSLTAVAEPALAWSGNLWTWNPQLGVTQDLRLSSSHDLRLQAAIIDVGDAPLPLTAASASTIGSSPTLAEQSRWPGIEGRIVLLGSTLMEEGSHIGVGGYFAPHLDPLGRRFNAWAGTLDERLQLPVRLSLTGSFYRGQALGGLGGGAYKDLAYRAGDPGKYYYHPLSDVGGWVQLKEMINERLQFNAAFGIDNAFANQLRRYAVPDGTVYQNLARNRTYTGNVIYSPSAYLIFSLEYRHLISSSITNPSAASNIIGLGAGYRF
jgi:hypothetical protein